VFSDFDPGGETLPRSAKDEDPSAIVRTNLLEAALELSDMLKVEDICWGVVERHRGDGEGAVLFVCS